MTALTPDGTALVYSTYFADAGTVVRGMAVSPGGVVFLTGVTSSTENPTVGSKAFVARIDPAATTATCGGGQFRAGYFGNETLTPPAARPQCETSISRD